MHVLQAQWSSAASKPFQVGFIVQILFNTSQFVDGNFYCPYFCSSSVYTNRLFYFVACSVNRMLPHDSLLLLTPFFTLSEYFFQMSAGLMSCVRENSPPLEAPPVGAGTNGPGGGQIIAGSQHITCSSNQLLDPNDIPITITTPEHLHQGKCLITNEKKIAQNLMASFIAIHLTEMGFPECSRQPTTLG